MSTLNPVVFSSKTDQWSTPRAFLRAVADEFGDFELDVCADAENAAAPRFFTAEDDGLKHRWDARVVWMNPPYGTQIGKWTAKALAESLRLDSQIDYIVGLIPAKTETRWWHRDVMSAAEIRFIRGRMRFGGSRINAPFPSALVAWSRHLSYSPEFGTMDRILDPEQW